MVPKRFSEAAPRQGLFGGGGTSKSQENCEALGSSFPLQSLLARSEPRGLGRRAEGRAARVRRRADGRAVHVQAR